MAALGWELVGALAVPGGGAFPGWPHLIKQGLCRGRTRAVLSEIEPASALCRAFWPWSRAPPMRFCGLSMNVTGNMMGFLDLVAWKVTQESLWESFHFRTSHFWAPSSSGDGALRPKRPTAHCLPLVTGEAIETQRNTRQVTLTIEPVDGAIAQWGFPDPGA